jgi:glycosyltransferase involved in cell wall biosynthesis
VCVIPYGINLNYSGSRSNSLKICRKIPIIGTLSRYVPQKDLKTLVFAARELKERGLIASFICHGEGPEKGELQKLVNENGLENTFLILDKTLDADSFLNWCDLFVLTSKYEGFGLVILEAARSGTPMVISNTAAANEVLSGNQQVLFQIGNFPQLAEKIHTLVTNPSAYSNNVKNSLDLAKRYDIRVTAESFIQLYESL